MSQWGRSVETTPNGRRRIMATARVGALFTHGHSPGYIDIERKIMNGENPVITTLAHPYGDLPYVPARSNVKTYTCPGCGIVPPRGRPCDQCWG